MGVQQNNNNNNLTLENRLPIVRRLAIPLLVVFWWTPDIPVAHRIINFPTCARFFKPFVLSAESKVNALIWNYVLFGTNLIGCVIHNQVHNKFHASIMDTFQKSIPVFECTILRIYVLIIGT